MATGAVHASMRDAQKRPITAGGFVEGAAVVFVDVTEKAGLGSFHHRSGNADKSYILEVPGSGVALLDYDNDGWLDIYLVNGSTVPALKGKEAAPRAALFHNNHDGTFTDVTAKAGVANERWGFGAAAADYDNDGWADLYVSNSARTGFITTTMMERLPTSPRRPESRWADGPPERRSGITMATGVSTCLSPGT